MDFRQPLSNVTEASPGKQPPDFAATEWSEREREKQEDETLELLNLKT